MARAKYRDETEDHLAFLRDGGHPLLPPEERALRPHLPGARVVHLQCSHGLDTLGLLNAGAARVTGLDISGEMIRLAREKTRALGWSATFVRSDVLDPPEELLGSADLVYTGKGALPWVMDLAAWAGAVARVVRPVGRVWVFEGH
ncbi:MAG TPA: class I SAM-dependent methyltransferase, partial [Longimicrobiales bacterium]|nr:class I SAM-dependent methyltransferase [Longimicrobiales bacterium]